MYKDYEIKLNAILDKHGVQKVELGGLIDIIKSSFGSAEKDFNKAKDGVKGVKRDLQGKLYANFDVSQRRYAGILKEVEKVEKGAERIGLDLPKEIQKIKKTSINNLKLSAKGAKAAKQAIASLDL